MEKPKISYPCEWSYKVIGSESGIILEKITLILADYDFQIAKSKESKTGKYTSFNVKVSVRNEEKRNEVFGLLKNIPTVKFVL